ncbi:MAG: histidinol-phosphate transaminase [Halieaceae bacterium]
MSRFWSPQIAELSPYVPGEQPQSRNLIKLNTNEMPFGPSPRALEAISACADDSLRLYPDPASTRLCKAFADVQGIRASQVFVGNGSDEVLAHTFRALFQPTAPLLFPDISYSFYPVYARFFDLNYQTVPLNADFEVELADYHRENGGIIFPNPNAPTGILTPLSRIAALLADNPDTVVVVDEAYVDFGGESATALIADYPNLLVVQTLSKSRALAGLRVGAAFGHEDLIEGLSRVKNSFNSYPLGRLSEAGAVAALEDADWFERSRTMVIRNREMLSKGLGGLGFEVLPSAANFVFARHPSEPALELQSALRQRDIIVRHFSQARIDQFLRISVGTEEHCAALLEALQEIIAG